MIKLAKGQEPTILQTNRQAWQQELKAEMDGGLTVNQAPTSKKYNQPEIKATLMESSHGKCMYCESKVRHVDHGEIEHIKPKVTFPESIFDWENLGFVCAVCNNTKRDQYNADILIVNPFVDEPSDHLVPIGATFFPKPGSDRGQITLTIVGLNRVDLVERRGERVKQLHTLLEKASRLPQALKQAIETEVQSFVAVTEEYAGTASAVLKAFNGNTR